MQLKKNISVRKKEQGVVIVLVALFMLFIVGAMAALAIDVVTLYTARSEAQLAADAGALAGARVLANSGMTSNPNPAMITGAVAMAGPIVQYVANHNSVGGITLGIGNLQPPPIFDYSTPSNPRVTVYIQVTKLPTFFSRIWGNQYLTVAASATAEAYNPSATGAVGAGGPPVAPICVKPWLLPNLDPTQATTATTIFGSDGSITNPLLVGEYWPNPGKSDGLYSLCGDCSPSGGGIPAPAPGRYYPGDPNDFPAPAAQDMPTGSSCSSLNSYQMAVAGCVQQPISCGANPNINIDTNAYATTADRDSDTVQAAKCLIHYNGGPTDTDTIDLAASLSPPHQFNAGDQNPVVSSRGQDVMVSDSLVTIPVIDATTAVPTNPVTVIGFLQVFLDPHPSTLFLGFPSPPPASNPNEIPAMIINLAGCGTSVTGSPILGNGASPVAVRLISQ